MKIFLAACLFLSSQIVIADDLLSILGGETQKEETIEVVQEKNRLDEYSRILKERTPEQNIFFGFLKKNDFQNALFQWDSAFNGTSFEDSVNGKALYNTLLLKNGVYHFALENINQLDPSKIDSFLLPKIIEAVSKQERVWETASFTWNDQWSEHFGLSSAIKVKSRQFSFKDIAETEDLLRATESGSWERGWMQWQHTLGLLETGDDIKAAKLLKNLIAQKKKPVSEDLLHMTIARVLYQNGFLDEAAGFYSKIPKKSDYWFEAQEESAWTALRSGRPADAMAMSKGLMHPSLSAEQSPELFYLKSLSELKVCDYQEVAKTLDGFKKRFRERAKDLSKTAERPSQELYNALRAGHSKERFSITELGALSKEAPRFSMRDEFLSFLFNRQEVLDTEAKTARSLYVSSVSGGSRDVGFQAEFERFAKKIESRAHDNKSETIAYISDLAETEMKEIVDTLTQLQIVEAELLQQISMAEALIAETNREPVEAEGTTGDKAKHTLKFPFNGEYWFDEVTSFKVDIAKGCHTGGKAL